MRWAGLWLACLFIAGTAHGFERIEAARSDWHAGAPPAAGWTSVTLPDSWTSRWPGFDGVVWYRLRWSEPADPAGLRPKGLMTGYFNMAGAVYLNGSLIGGDSELVEPLSRGWNLPRYWVLDAPLLRPGANELLVRVSGLAAYQPGLGAVTLGEPDLVRAAYRRATLVHRSLPLLGIGLTLVMGVLYGMLWLMRRSERSYGWFSLFCLLWVAYSYNYVALGTWPFDSTEAFQRANHIAMLASIGCFLMFALHFCQLAGAGLRWILLASTGAGIALLVLAPSAIQVQVRNHTVLATLLLYVGGCVVILRHALRSRQLEAAVLSAFLVIPVMAGVHDTLVFLEYLPGNRYYATLSSSATLLGISFVLTWRMVKDMRLAEHFNAELKQRVEEATRRLADGLGRQHAAELVQTRLTERLSLVRDLHDGLGMTLSSHIHSLGKRPDSDDGALWALKEVNDDLRLIIESSAFDDTEELAERLLPLRHRSTRLLEAADIECRWRFAGLQSCRLGGKRDLDFLRVLQEALANVVKHSGATRVDVAIEAAGGQLALSVRDNGRGIAPDAASRQRGGMGLKNMQARAARLGGQLAVHSSDAGTTLELHCPIDTTVSP
jgi:signal transduction histidine kinase